MAKTKSKPSKSKRSSKAKLVDNKVVVKSKRIKSAPAKRLPSVWSLIQSSSRVLADNKQLFIGIALVYGLLSLILVQGLAKSNDVTTLKSQLGNSFHGQLAAVNTSVTLFVTLLGSSASSTTTGSSPYQFFLGIIASLATIWALRQVLAGSKVRIRDAFYRGMGPLIPFILVLAVIGLQLLPILIGVTIFGLVINNGIAALAIEKIVWGLIIAMISLVSLYFITSSILALYIVTLPDMTPLKALRSARKLVKKRRWLVLRKLIALPIAIIIVVTIIMLPVLFWMTPLTPWVFYALTIAALVVGHAYIYTLYRELLNE